VDATNRCKDKLTKTTSVENSIPKETQRPKAAVVVNKKKNKKNGGAWGGPQEGFVEGVNRGGG